MNTTLQGTKLEKGAGFVIIYKSEVKIELSAKGKFLRRTIIQKGKPHEYLYERVTDLRHIGEIEERSIRWKFIHGKRYCIGMQMNTDGKSTGNIKIVDEPKCLRRLAFPCSDCDRTDDFTYYAKRKG